MGLCYQRIELNTIFLSHSTLLFSVFKLLLAVGHPTRGLLPGLGLGLGPCCGEYACIFLKVHWHLWHPTLHHFLHYGREHITDTVYTLG